MRGKPEDLLDRKFTDLLVIGPPRRLNRSKNRFWTCQCLRPIHGESFVTRQVTRGELKKGTITACVTCMHADRKGKPRMKGGAIDQAPLTQAQVAARGCAQLLCHPPFHNADCVQLNLFKPYSQRDVGDGVNLR